MDYFNKIIDKENRNIETLHKCYMMLLAGLHDDDIWNLFQVPSFINHLFIAGDFSFAEHLKNIVHDMPLIFPWMHWLPGVQV